MGQNIFTQSRRSDTLSRERLRSLRAPHVKAAGDFAAALTALLRCRVDVELDGIEQLPYGRFLDKLGRTSYFTHLRAEPPGESVLLDVEPPIVYPMIDRLLGGGRVDEPPPNRPLSDIESPLAARIVRLFLEKLTLAWHNLAGLKFKVIQADSNPRLLRALHSDDMTVSVEFRLTVGARQGMMRLCVPCRAIQRLDADQTPAADPPVVLPTVKTAVADPQSTLEVCVTLATTPIAAADLAALQVGDIVVTETEADGPAVVSFSGGPKFRAKPGVCRGRNAVCITTPVGEG